MHEESFTDTVDEALCGKFVRVHCDVGVFEGWVDRTAPDRGSILLHDATNVTAEESIGSVFLRTCTAVEVLRPAKRIEFCAISDLNPYPDYEYTDPPAPEIIQRAYRTKFPGEFPVVRENGTIITGHDHVAAADVVGLKRIPVEIVAVNDDQASELFRLAHDGETTSNDDEADPDDDDDDSEDTSPVYGYGD